MNIDRGFTSEEFEQRCQRVQRAMQSCNADALLLSSEAEIRYFTGFMTQFWQSQDILQFRLPHQNDLQKFLLIRFEI